MSTALVPVDTPAFDQSTGHLTPYSTVPKRSDALLRVAASAAALCDALHAVDIPTGDDGWRQVRLVNGGLAAALDELARSRGRTPGLTKQKTVGPRTEKDARGYKRPESNQPGYGKGRIPRNKGRVYPADPPTLAEVVTLVYACPDTPHGRRLAAWIVFAYRTALRVSESLDVMESDVDLKTGAVIVRCGKGGKRRVVGLDSWGREYLEKWMLADRPNYPSGPVFCVLDGPTAGRRWDSSRVRRDLSRLRVACGIRRRIAPHQLRHAWTVEALREELPLHVIMRQLGHANLAITTKYIEGITAEEILEATTARRPPQIAVPDLMEVFRGR